MPATTETPTTVELEPTAREILKSIYRDYFNNYLTVDKFSEHNGLNLYQGQRLIDLAREVHNSPHPEQ